MARLFEELKRRNVLRTAAAYAVVVWIVIQVADITFPILGFPDAILSAVVILAILGFPVTIVVSWFYEWTPGGIMTESEAAAAGYARPSAFGRQIDFVIIALLVVAVGWLVWRQEGGPAVMDKSIAVLPFANLSRDDANAPFADGIHDDLLTQISKIKSLRTVSRTSVLRYRGSDKPIPEIARELGVATILEGGIQRVGDRVRINAQLIDAVTDEHLWAETYDRDLTATNIFAIQSEIATAIAAALRATLSPEDKVRLASLPTEDMAALDAYFQGKKLLGARTGEALSQSVEQFQRAVEIDADFALAYSGLADAYMVLQDFATTSDRDLARERSQVAAARALALDPDLPEALASTAWSRLIHDYDWQGAETLFRRALEVHPSNISALHWISHLLSWRGRHAEAIEQARRAVVLDPVSPLMRTNLVYIYMEAGEYDKAVDLARGVLKQDNFPALLRILWLTQSQARQYNEASETLLAWAAATGRDEAAAQRLGELISRHKLDGESVTLSDELVAQLRLGSQIVAQAHAFVGDREKTIEALGQAYAERSGSWSIMGLKINPAYDFIRPDPRFTKLTREIGLQP